MALSVWVDLGLCHGSPSCRRAGIGVEVDIDKQKQKNNPVYFATTVFKEGKFNIFGLEWYPDRLDFFVNGRKTFSYPRLARADSRQWPFDQPYYIILNQALGGNWAGAIDERDLPVQMEVDWVRVYQKGNPRQP